MNAKREGMKKQRKSTKEHERAEKKHKKAEIKHESAVKKQARAEKEQMYEIIISAEAKRRRISQQKITVASRSGLIYIYMCMYE
jgi:acetyl-CoA carboxylase carboxyltransferase component